MKILLVEDESHTQEILQTALSRQNFLVDQATDGEMAWELIQQFNYDLVLLDVMLPKLDGFSLCRRLRQADNPVLILLLTIRDRLNDKILGFESGADDYLTKPFALPELFARIRSLTRRQATLVPPVLSYGLLSLNLTSRQITYAGQPLKVGRKEYLFLELLLRHPNRVFSRSEIIDRLWSLDQEVPNESTIKSHVRSIRRKLEQVGAKNAIETLYGQGYRLNPELLQSSQSPLSAAPAEHAIQEDSILEQVNQFTAQVWQRAYTKSLQQLNELEQAILSLSKETREEATRPQAIFMAHRLAGALSVFGFDRAAQMLLKIEDMLRQAQVSPDQVPQLLEGVRLVRSELEGQSLAGQENVTLW